MRTTRAAIAAAAILFTVAACTSDPAQPVSPPVGAGSATGGSVAPVQSGTAPFVLEGEAGPVPNATEFLTATESVWREGLTHDDVAVSEEARCYYAVTDAGSANALVCGPVRRAGSDATSVWDVLGVAIDTDTNKAKRDTDEDRKSQPLPTFGDLMRPDGQTPPAPSELAEPDAPAAPTDLFAQVDPAAGKPVDPVTVDPSTATLLTPYGSVAVIASAKLDQVSGITKLMAGDLPDLSKTYGHADGHHLITFTVETTPDVPAAFKALDEVDGQTGNEKPVPAKVTFDGGAKVDLTQELNLTDTTYRGGAITFVASVPTAPTPR